MADGTLPQLPDDVLQVIYGEVPLRRLLAHRAVCSHLDRVLPMVVQHINLDDRCIGAAGAACLSAALPGCAALQTLDLAFNNISAAGTASLSAALPGCSALQTLELGLNSIGAAGAASLSAALPNCTTLQTLRLGSNDIGAAGAASLKSAWLAAGKATGGL